MTEGRKGINEREIVLDILLELESGREYIHILLKNVLDKYNYLDTHKKAFIRRLASGVTERRLTLDYVLNQYSSIKMHKCKPVIRCLLRMGVYQILYMDAVPDSAACNEAVSLAVKRHFQQLKGFVNGVLRTVARQKDAITWPDAAREPVRALSVAYSMPEWLVEKWVKEYGGSRAEQILQGFMKPRSLTIRLTNLVQNGENQEKYLQSLKNAGIIVRDYPELPYAFRLEKTDAPAGLPGYADGYFAVQDISSMLVTECAGIGSSDQREAGADRGLFVLDVCAAPGGKALHAADCLKNMGRVEARDLTEYKTGLIQENALRLKVNNAAVKLWDAAQKDETMLQKADIVIADLPCSGLGVMGRKPDIRYRLDPAALEEVNRLQRQILDTVWEYVKPGGVLIYSTCTVNREENEDTADWFVKNHPFQVQSVKAYLPPAMQEAVDKSGYLQLLPGIYDTDGFFISRFVRDK